MPNLPEHAMVDKKTIAAIHVANAPYNTRTQVQPDTANAADGTCASSLEVPLMASSTGDTGNITLGLPLNGTGNGCEDDN
ncbi:hypothetical protein [Ralstonia solanacearum]|uniref:hypothetical protein n=1 Tax=Ralstonia solanacearum TaxID=305 RepID=UPI0018D14AC0|nr:hypothetical protein [Ralstonia solanacearum]